MQTYSQEINDALQQYGHCLLPDIGLLYIIRSPAERSYRDNKLYPPSFHISLDPGTQSGRSSFSIVRQIAHAHSLSPEEAEKAWTETAAAIKKKLSTGSSVELTGLGWLNLNEEGQPSFTEARFTPIYEPLPTDFIPKPPKAVAAPAVLPDEQNEDPAEILPAESNLTIPSDEKAWRSINPRWWIAGSIIALLLVGWFTYKGTIQRREKASALREILNEERLSRQTATADSLALLSADSAGKHQPAENDSIHYKIIIAVYNNKSRALHQFNKMRNWGHPVVLDTQDSVTYKLAMPFTSIAADTTVNLVNMMKLYGNKVHIEYDTKE